ncbi:hypothetical protein [uncultured Enterococcus sp.]|uniref:hypothetical protein n=1 Tax=uncultured Enterococcus sp. TaxID=167972 RepID=UPI002AA6C3B6|nr:hypothetical protein [uncultured Enterococcus sp.]
MDKPKPKMVNNPRIVFPETRPMKSTASKIENIGQPACSNPKKKLWNGKIHEFSWDSEE